jgi:hypothetical protein
VLQFGFCLVHFPLQTLLLRFALPNDIAAFVACTVNLYNRLLDLIVHLHVREDVVKNYITPDTAHCNVELTQPGYFGRDLFDLLL